MGTSGMRFSLYSRDVIADSIETVIQAMAYDSVVSVVGCDKNMPGALMAMLRLNRPGLLVYGGTIAPGCYKGRKLDVVSAFEAWGENVSGKISNKDYKSIIKNACQVQAPVEECIQQTQWQLQLKLWECVFPTIHQILLLVIVN